MSSSLRSVLQSLPSAVRKVPKGRSSSAAKRPPWSRWNTQSEIARPACIAALQLGSARAAGGTGVAAGGGGGLGLARLRDRPQLLRRAAVGARAGDRPLARLAIDAREVREERGERRARIGCERRRRRSRPRASSRARAAPRARAPASRRGPSVDRARSRSRRVRAAARGACRATRPRRAGTRPRPSSSALEVISPTTTSALARRCLSAARLSSPPSGTWPGSELPLTSALPSIACKN